MPEGQHLLEVKTCSGYVLVGRERDAQLEPLDDDPQGQKWIVSCVFKPETGVVGWLLTDVNTGAALKFEGSKERVGMGSGRDPIPRDVVWNITAVDEGPYVVISPVDDPGQALDKKGDDDCNGTFIQTWDINRGDHQQWRFLETK